MRLLSLDVSTTKTGWALFNSNTLSYMGNISPPRKSDWYDRTDFLSRAVETLADRAERVVMEWPEFHSGSSFRSVRMLAFACGRIVGHLDRTGIPVKLFTPSQWKGNVPKSVTIHRCNKFFSTEFTMKDNDMVDAIMLGKWYIEKKMRGKAYSRRN